jgi:hypothetical protein
MNILFYKKKSVLIGRLVIFLIDSLLEIFNHKLENLEIRILKYNN